MKVGISMEKKSTYISFDYDNDLALKNLLVGQSRLEDSPFSIKDVSIKEAVSTDWKAEARKRIKGSDVVAVICGEQTNNAKGVSIEIEIAQEEKIPYFLLRGYPDKTCYKPKAANQSDKIYNWTWDNLKKLINGQR